MQQLTIIGNVGQDAVLKSANGRDMLRFSVAVNNRRRNEHGEQIEDTAWYTVFTGQTALAQYLTKGTQVCVVGPARFAISDGQYGYRLDLTINANTIQLLGSKRDNAEPPQPAPVSQPQPVAPQPTARGQAQAASVPRPDARGRIRSTPPLDLQAIDQDDDLPF